MSRPSRVARGGPWGSISNAMDLYLIRHGETAHNRDGLGLGRADAPLTAVGKAQTLAAAARFGRGDLEAVYASPLVRARALGEAMAMASGGVLDVREELIEMDVGETEGLTFAAMAERFGPFIEAWRGPAPEAVTMPGGESLCDVDARLAPLLDELAARAPETNALAIVSHNFVLRVIVCRLLGIELSGFRSLAVDLASVSHLRWQAGRFAAVTLNDRCHLEALER